MTKPAAVVLGKGTRPRKLSKLRNHTVIFGWSDKTAQIVSELAIANQNVRKAALVIVSQRPTEEVEQDIKFAVSDLGKLKIHYLSSELGNSELIEMTGITRAKSAIVLAENSSLDLIKNLQSKAKNVVTEFQNKETGATFENVVSVDGQALQAKLIAQATRNDEIAILFRELLDFSGDEIYFASIPALSGKSYADAILAFNQASVIGLVEDGVAKVNPAMDTLLTRETKIIAIALDDDQVIYTGVREDIAQTKLEPKLRTAKEPADLLIIGWSNLAKQVLEELSTFLPNGSKVQIAAKKEIVNNAELQSLAFENLSISTHLIEAHTTDLELIKTLKFKEVIILDYGQLLHDGSDDPRVLEVLAEVEQLGARVIFAGEADSDELGSLLMAQLSENPQLESVLSDLFDAKGATVNVRNIEDYAPLGVPVTFAELAAKARNFSESAIGYKVAEDHESLLNPNKTLELTPKRGDSLIVVGDL